MEQMQEMLTSSTFSGLVAVMASWCPPCREELPILQKVYESLVDQRIHILALSVDADGVSAVQPLINELKISFPVFWVGTEAIRHYRISGVPTLLVIRRGVIQQQIPGSLPRRALDSIIGHLTDAS